MDIPYLDIQNLHLSSELQNFVLGLPDIQSISCSARRGIDCRVEISVFCVHGSLGHRVYGIEDVRGNCGQVDASEGVDEYSIRFLLGSSALAV